MHKLHIYKGNLVATRLEIQYYDESLMYLDISVGILSLLTPGKAIVPWIWAADEKSLQGKRLKESGWHLPLLIDRWRTQEALTRLNREVLFTPVENIQVLEKMEDDDLVLRTYVPISDDEWDISDEIEIILEDADFMLGI